MLADLPNTTASELGAVVSKDPALSTRLLKLVNSAYFGMPRKVDTLTRAINLIGIVELRHLTLAASAKEVFADIDSRLFDMAAFWQHSVYCGLVARKLAEHASVLHSERLFTSGLLHDIGRLLMLMELPDEMEAVVVQQHELSRDVCKLEIEQVGFDHAEAGETLLLHWNLPSNLCTSVRYHHEPELARDANLETAILHVADQIAHSAQDVYRPENPRLYDPFRALLNAAENAEEISTAALALSNANAVSLGNVTQDSMVNAVKQASADFDQVLEIIYPSVVYC